MSAIKRSSLIAFILGIAFCGVFFVADEVVEYLRCVKVDYINPEFACGNDAVISKTGYAVTKAAIDDYFAARKAEGAIDGASIYFRDLEDGPVFGINETAVYAPASLLKLPSIIGILRMSEDGPALLKDVLVYDPVASGVGGHLNQYEAPQPDIVTGQSYPLSELMRVTVQYSDNPAYFTALNHVAHDIQGGNDELARSFQELGVIDPRNIEEPTVSVRGYAGLFRMLYNASYLSVENSELLLGWLSHSTYRKGIVAGVPAEVSVAHKFGERLLSNGTKQLHDCGIIYYPGNPYVLCVMTQGDDWDHLAATIARVSEMIYTEVDSRKIN